MRKISAPVRGKPPRCDSLASVPSTPPPANEVAAYLADMSMQLAGMASQAKLDRLGYLLTLAAIEAQLAQGK